MSEDGIEFGFVGVAEEDIVPEEFEPVRTADARPRDRGEGTLRIAQGQRPGRGVAECALRKGRAIGVADDRRRVDPLAVPKPDASRPSAARIDIRDVSSEAEDDAFFARKALERVRELDHSALDRPDPGLLDMRDEHQCRRCKERRSAAIGRVARKQLAQARVPEAPAEIVPQRLERIDAEQGAETAGRGAPDQRGKVRSRGAHERMFESVERAARPRAEAKIARRRIRAGEGPDRVGGTRDVGKEIQSRAVAPRVSRQRLERPQIQSLVEPGARVREESVEDVPQRQDGRTRVDRSARCLDDVDLAAGARGALEHGDRQAGAGQIDRRGKTADACADHDHAVARYARAHRVRPISVAYNRLDTQKRQEHDT